MTPDTKQARLAGLFYLLTIIFGTYAEFFVRKKLITDNQVQETAQHILNHTELFRIGFISDLMMQLSFFLLVMVLYRILNKVNHYYAVFMVSCVLLSVAIMSLNMLHQLGVLLMLENESLLASLSSVQLDQMIYMFMDLHKHGYRIAQLFFGIWLLPLGILVYKSKFFPKSLGLLLILAFVSFSVDFFLFFLLPGYPPSLSFIVTLPTVVAEFSFCLWLLIKGVRKPNALT